MLASSSLPCEAFLATITANILYAFLCSLLFHDTKVSLLPLQLLLLGHLTKLRNAASTSACKLQLVHKHTSINLFTLRVIVGDQKEMLASKVAAALMPIFSLVYCLQWKY